MAAILLYIVLSQTLLITNRSKTLVSPPTFSSKEVTVLLG
jgi:hypothetical protein